MHEESDEQQDVIEVQTLHQVFALLKMPFIIC